MPDRDPRGPEHRPDRRPGHLRPGQRVRLHRDPLPQGGRRPGHRRGRLPGRRRGGGARHRPGQRLGRRRRQLHRGAGPRPPRPAGHRRAGGRGQHLLRHHQRDRLRAAVRGRPHGRLAEADRLGVHGPHPLRRARRRQPGPHGRQHAEAGGAPRRPRGPLHRHRGRGPRRPRRRRRGAGRGRRHGHRGLRRPDRGRVPVRAEGPPRPPARPQDLPAGQVPPLQPEHLDQPEGPGRRGAEGRGRRPAGRRPLHPQRRAGPGQEPARGLHALGGLQLRGRHHPLPAPGARRRAHLHPHRGARGRRPGHQARGRGDHPGHPQPLRGDPGRPRRAGDHPHRAPRWARATCWWARSPPRARPSRPPRSGCCGPSSARRPGRSATPASRCPTARRARSSTSGSSPARTPTSCPPG